MFTRRSWKRASSLLCLTRPSRPNLAQPRWLSTSTSVRDSISSPLLSRARSLAQEHTAIRAQLASDYDAKAAKRLGELKKTAEAVEEYDSATSSLKELHTLLRSDDEELSALAREDVSATESRIEAAGKILKESLIPVHPFAHLPCLMELRPGAGGDEAGLFAGDLLYMYTQFCSNNNLSTSLIKLETREFGASGAGAPGSGGMHVQEAILEIETEGAYGLLRGEAGVHRVQRVPATETKGRTHTSAVSVLVLPSIPASSSDGGASDFDDPESDSYIDPKDVRTDVLRASGAGGQHVNKTESAVRLTHTPTGITVFMQEQRSQIKNREKAWQVLRSRIAQARREEREAEEASMRRIAGAGRSGRGDKVRTYNWGQQRVSDHRNGFESRNLDDVVAGGEALEKVMESVRGWMVEQEILALGTQESEGGVGKTKK